MRGQDSGFILDHVVCEIPFVHNSGIVLSGLVNEKLFHCVPLESESCGPRASLVFRRVDMKLIHPSLNQFRMHNGAWQPLLNGKGETVELRRQNLAIQTLSNETKVPGSNLETEEAAEIDQALNDSETMAVAEQTEAVTGRPKAQSRRAVSKAAAKGYIGSLTAFMRK